MPPSIPALALPRVRTIGATWRWVLGVWLASRVAFLVAGGIGTAIVRHAGHFGVAKGPGGTFGYWANWDGAWFVGIATHGYGSASATAFFPLYPLLIRA